jgi:pectate lyase
VAVVVVGRYGITFNYFEEYFEFGIAVGVGINKKIFCFG